MMSPNVVAIKKGAEDEAAGNDYFTHEQIWLQA